MQYQEEEKFSDDPTEHLRIENEIIKMKLKAQFGDQFQVIGDISAISPEIENQFLKNMIQMEESYRNADFITILEKIGNPVLKNKTELTKKQLKKEIENLLELIKNNSLHIEFLDGPYADEVVYDFLVNEFVQLTVEKEIMEGMCRNYIYEEFHPNHKVDVTKLSEQFLHAWTTKNLAVLKNTWQETLMAPKKISYTQDELAQKINHIFDSFERFDNVQIDIKDIEFDVDNDEEDSIIGTGCTKGYISFEGIIANGDKVDFSGNFTLYYTYEYAFWSIFYFVMPGFNWQPQTS
jgi:hypothetical protein